MGNLIQDARYALRMLAKNPGFTLIAVLTLALGIGANTALFSVVNGVLLNPLPYPHPDRLITLGQTWGGFAEASISYPDFLDWARMNHSFEALAAYRPDDFILTGSGKTQRLKANGISANFFSVLGVNPVMGRDFLADDDRRGATPVVMLSGGLWKSRFGASPKILGETLTLNGTAYRVVGVVPENFYFCCEWSNFHLSDIYVPIGATNARWAQDRNSHPGTRAVGRLKAGVTLAQARADMDEVARNLSRAYPDADKNTGIALTPLKREMVADVEPMLLVLLAAVGFVLLIACANVANLLLARATGRAREFAIRGVLGATPGRVIRQLLTESVLLGVAGGTLGVLLASWGTEAALQVLPEALPRANDVHPDPRVLAFTLAISVFAGVLFGLAPALKTLRPDLHATLKESGRGSSGVRHRAQSIFVAVELALAVVLLIGAGLTIRSLSHLWSVNPGFDGHNVLNFDLDFSPATAKETPDQVRAMLQELPERIARIPGVEIASLMDASRPMWGDDEEQFWIGGRARPATMNEMPETLEYIVSRDYLKVMKTPLLRGRFFNDTDNPHSRFVGVIDESFARLYFPGQDPIGQRVILGHKDIPIEIVGVVGHIKQWGLDENGGGPVRVQLYTLAEQMPDDWMPGMSRGAGVTVRTATPKYPSPDAIRAAVQNMNSEQVAYDFETMDETVADSVSKQRFAMILLGVFAGIALVLASIGIYGVMSYVAGQRTHEIGVRMALGAQREDVLKLMLRDAGRMILLGLPVGLVAAGALTALIKNMLFGVSGTDPLTFASVAALLCLVALAACCVPARRAMRVDPIEALRHE